MQNRILKFRQFLRGKWHYWGLIDGVFISPAENIRGSEKPATTPHCQFTGLKDIDGKEIYEGDIVEGNIVGIKKEKNEIYFGKIGFDGAWNGMSGFYLKRYENDGFMQLQYHCDSTQIKIIGNIYENPELIK